MKNWGGDKWFIVWSDICTRGWPCMNLRPSHPAPRAHRNQHYRKNRGIKAPVSLCNLNSSGHCLSEDGCCGPSLASSPWGSPHSSGVSDNTLFAAPLSIDSCIDSALGSLCPGCPPHPFCWYIPRTFKFTPKLQPWLLWLRTGCEHLPWCSWVSAGSHASGFPLAWPWELGTSYQLSSCSSFRPQFKYFANS